VLRTAIKGLKELKMQSFTCLVKREGNQYASLCIELDVASCGRTKTEAIEGLKNAIEAYIEYMASENRGHEISRPVPMDELKAFLFTEDTKDEQSFKAIALEVEHA
jgi:predicted RNase H-like HicB family nuclease